jgi:hypothetical protein
MLAIPYQSLILIMGSDPHPDKALSVSHSQGAMAGSYSGRPEVPDLLEME